MHTMKCNLDMMWEWMKLLFIKEPNKLDFTETMLPRCLGTCFVLKISKEINLIWDGWNLRVTSKNLCYPLPFDLHIPENTGLLNLVKSSDIEASLDLWMGSILVAVPHSLAHFCFLVDASLLDRNSTGMMDFTSSKFQRSTQKNKLISPYRFNLNSWLLPGPS